MTYKTIALPARSTKETKAYNQAVEKGLDSYFVVQNGSGWYVRKASSKAGRGTLFQTKAAALRAAHSSAAKSQSEVFTFNKEGDLLSREAPQNK